MSPEDQQISAADGSWDILLYVFCTALMIIGLTLLASLPVVLCHYFRKPEKVYPPPTPLCKRQVSVHVAYPPTPHIIRLPQLVMDTELDSPSVYDLEGPPDFWAQQPSGQELKMNPVILNPMDLTSSLHTTDFHNSGQGHVLLSLSDEKKGPVVRMPNFIEDLPFVHMDQPPAYTSVDDSVKASPAKIHI